jgi:hypothetical protein
MISVGTGISNFYTGLIGVSTENLMWMYVLASSKIFSTSSAGTSSSTASSPSPTFLMGGVVSKKTLASNSVLPSTESLERSTHDFENYGFTSSVVPAPGAGAPFPPFAGAPFFFGSAAALSSSCGGILTNSSQQPLSLLTYSSSLTNSESSFSQLVFLFLIAASSFSSSVISSSPVG